ncbi:FAD:protein FMN transferase [Myxococcota bacterium]|nr:FAD:protein FMN transferase [Myxococcota bacterium]
MAIAFVLLSGVTIHRFFFATPPGAAVDELVLSGETMGTTWEVRIAGEGLDESLRARAQDVIENRLAEIDLWFSTWRPDSEVSRFNAHRSQEPFDVSSPTAELIAFSIELCKWSGGAFDITVAPLVARWGFGHRAQVGAPPSEAEIEEYLDHTGAEIIHVGRGNPTRGGFLLKNDPEVEIDLSAIAPGYAADHVAGGLYELGRGDFLVEIGGEIYAAGHRPDGRPWRVAIEEPVEEARRIHSVVEISNQGLATSGDYRAFYVEDGQRISHTIDPRTGRPIANGMASATVIAPTATQADGFATALMVLGPEKGLALAEQWKLGAMTLLRGADGGFAEERNALYPEPITDERAAELDSGRLDAGEADSAEVPKP